MKNIKMTSIAATMCMTMLAGVISSNIGWAKSTEEKVKDWIDDKSDYLKRKVDEFGDDLQAAQAYLDNYHWRGLIEDEASSGPATLKHLELNRHPKVVIVKPGERVEAEVDCDLDPKQCSLFGMYRIVVGVKGEGPQAVIGNESGISAGKTREEFALIAPNRAGIYQIRFRSVDAFTKRSALDSWRDKEGNEPDGTTTVGIIIVKE